MSAIEVAGLVLTVIPLAIKAAKWCSEGFEEGKKIFRTRDHDEIKRDLFDDLNRELVLFHRHVKKVLQALPDISEQRCNEVLNDLDQQNWQKQSDIVQALQSYFGVDFEPFSYAIAEVHFWINGILEEKNLASQGASKVRHTLFSNLK